VAAASSRVPAPARGCTGAPAGREQLPVDAQPGRVTAQPADRDPGGLADPCSHLAARAIEHGLELCSNDADFARFSEIRRTNPVAPA